MTRYVAFLRAVNVGGRVVKMDELRSLFEAIKLANVETFIASGNVIFETSKRDASKLESQIESHLQKSLGYKVETFLRTTAEIAEIVSRKPFNGDEGLALHVCMLPAAPEAAAVAAMLALQTPTDRFEFIGRELWWLCHTRFNETKITAKAMERALRMPNTARSISTMRKLAAKYPAS